MFVLLSPSILFYYFVIVELPPGDDGVDGREHYSSLVNQTWPRVLPAVPHQIIVYEEDSDSEEEDNNGFGGDQGFDDAIENAEILLDGAAVAAEGDLENKNNENGATENDANNVLSSSSSASSILKNKTPPFEIHILCVGEEDVMANGAEKVGAEAAEAALNEALSGGDDIGPPPQILLSNCIYLVVGTRGGDDGATHDDLHDGVDEEVVVADDRDIAVSVGSVWSGERNQAWLTLDCVIASFADPLTAEKGHMVLMSTPLVSMPYTSTFEKRWKWSWKKEMKKQAEEKETETETEVAAEGDENNALVEDGSLIVPECKGTWEKMSTAWKPSSVLYFPLPEPTEEEIAAATEAEADETTASAIAIPTIESIPSSTFTACVSNHLSYPSNYPLSASRIVLKRMSDGQKTVLETTNVISKQVHLYIDVPYNGSKASRMYEVIEDAPAGTTLTIMSDEKMEFLDLSQAKSMLLNQKLETVTGTISQSNQNQMSIPFRLHFEIPEKVNDETVEEAAVVEAKEGEEETTDVLPLKTPSSLDIDVSLTIHDVDVQPYVTLYIINEDDGTETQVPLHSFTKQNFIKNMKGYTIMATVCSTISNLPSSEYTLNVLTSESLLNVTRHTTEGVLNFTGEYYPNKYYRLMRDVITPGILLEGDEERNEAEDVEGEMKKMFCPYATLRFKVSSNELFLFWGGSLLCRMQRNLKKICCWWLFDCWFTNEFDFGGVF